MKITHKLLKLLCMAAIFNINAQDKSYLDKKKPIEERINILMKQMTLEEKVGQMNQYNGFCQGLSISLNSYQLSF